jgi:hypothetical protein
MTWMRHYSILLRLSVVLLCFGMTTIYSQEFTSQIVQESSSNASQSDDEQRPFITDTTALPLFTPPRSVDEHLSDQTGEHIDAKPKHSSFGPPGMGGAGGPGYGFIWYPSADTTGDLQDSQLSVIRQRINVGAPIWGNGNDMAMMSFGIQNSMFSTDAVLPDSEKLFPSDLWNISIGTNFMHKFDNGWTGMAGINFGSASDKPFHSIDEMNIGFMSFLQVPAKNERDMWMFMLMYSPVGTFNFPLPGIAYKWNPSETFQASIGIPFSFTWIPYENLTLNVTYMPIINVNFKATYKISEALSAYVEFESAQEAYLLADREDIQDRFMGFEKRLIGGFQWNLGKYAMVDFSGGYAFDRYFGVGENQIGGSGLSDRIDIGSGAFVSATLSVRF